MVVRAKVDIPPFVDIDWKTIILKAGDIASVAPSIADLLVRRGKAELVEVPA